MRERKFILGDCMDPAIGLPSYPDNYFDLAIVDPPYGIGMDWTKRTERRTPKPIQTTYTNKEKPGGDYWFQLFRVSKNWIIWGWNYYPEITGPTNYLIIWNKGQQNFGSEAEIAATNMAVPVRVVNIDWSGARKGSEVNIPTIHPHQKPISLYRWLLENYAQTGDLILDTHVGSASSLIACESMGFDYVGYEIDPDYYAAAKNRMSKGIQLVIQ